MKRPASSADRLGDAARQAQRRATLAREDPEPSLARRLGQVGLLGWMIVTPLLLGLLVGRGLDRLLGSGVLFSAALVVAGAGLGLWSAWRWMHRQ